MIQLIICQLWSEAIPLPVDFCGVPGVFQGDTVADIANTLRVSTDWIMSHTVNYNPMLIGAPDMICKRSHIQNNDLMNQAQRVFNVNREKIRDVLMWYPITINNLIQCLRTRPISMLSTLEFRINMSSVVFTPGLVDVDNTTVNVNCKHSVIAGMQAMLSCDDSIGWNVIYFPQFSGFLGLVKAYRDGTVTTAQIQELFTYVQDHMKADAYSITGHSFGIVLH